MFAQPRKRKTFLTAQPAAAQTGNSDDAPTHHQSQWQPSTMASAVTTPRWSLCPPGPYVTTAEQLEVPTSAQPHFSPHMEHQLASPNQPRRPWPCRVCGVQLSTPSNRKRHERAKHPEAACAQLDGRFRNHKVASVTLSSESEVSAESDSTCSQERAAKRRSSPGSSQLSAIVEVDDSDSESSMQSDTSNNSSNSSESSESQSESDQSHSAESSDSDNHSDSSSSDESEKSALHESNHDATESEPEEHEHESDIDEEATGHFNTRSANGESNQVSDGTQSDQSESGSAAAASTGDERCISVTVAASGPDPAAVAVAPTWNFQQLSSLPNAPTLLPVDAFQAECEPFFTWLMQPPITQYEALVKARRVRNSSQLLPMHNNMRFLFVTMNEHTFSEASASSRPQQLSLNAFSELHTCQRLLKLLESRQVGSARIYGLFLLIKKVLVYLSSVASLTESKMVAPISLPSFYFVDNVCSDASLQRKQESRNRSLLGMQAVPFGKGSASMTAAAHSMDQVPLRTSQHSEEQRQARSESHGSEVHAFVAPRAQLATMAAVPGPARASGNMSSATPPIAGIRCVASLSKDDLQLVASGSLKELANLQVKISTHPQGHARRTIKEHKDLCTRYVQFLATATLCLGLAPRSQFLQQLRIGTTLIKEKGQYWMRLLAELNKNGKPCMMVLPQELTAPYDFYLEVIRPNMLKGQQHDYVYCKHDGKAPRPEFSSFTTVVTNELLGRPINAHTFRSGVITTFYESGATQGEMDVLANLMAHDAATAKTHYFRPQFAKAAVKTNTHMTRLLLQHPTRPAAAAATFASPHRQRVTDDCIMMDIDS